MIELRNTSPTEASGRNSPGTGTGERELVVPASSDRVNLGPREVELPDLDRFRLRLDSLPCIDPAELMYFAAYRQGTVETRPVPVSLILGGTLMTTWDMTDRARFGLTAPEYIHDLARKLHEGKIEIVESGARSTAPGQLAPPDLMEVEGIYLVIANGRHRVAAYKGLSNDLLIPASVQQATAVHIKVMASNADRNEIEARRKAGLWSGDYDGERCCWTITHAAGPWVFAKDMDKAKQVYRQGLG
jgi:hypothetical protein